MIWIVFGVAAVVTLTLVAVDLVAPHLLARHYDRRLARYDDELDAMSRS